MTTKPSLKAFCFGLLLSTLNSQLATLFAQVPSVISYQGRVKVQSTDFTGPGEFKFALVSPGTNISLQATATAIVTSGFITGITVTDGGVGYTSAPAVAITDATGSGATAVAQVSGGAVTNVAVQTAGNGYSSAPTVTIALPPPSLVYGTFWSNDGTSNAGNEPVAAVPSPVQQGLFSVFLGDTNLPNMQPVPADVFTQSDAHLRIWFSDGTNGFAQLAPDLRFGSVGYAMMAAQVNDAAINAAALANNSVTTGKLATNAVTSERIADATISVSDLSLSLLDGTFWKLTGNGGLTPGIQFLGTTDNQPLELRVNNQRALRLEPTASNATVNVVGGSERNFVSTGVVGATIAGGGSGDYGGSAYTNSVAADFGTIGGGAANTIATNATNSVISGGYLNDIGVESAYSAIGGGDDNNIAGAAGLLFGSPYSTIGGGQANHIGTESSYSVIAGGRGNDVGVNGGVSASYSAVGGGNNNNIGASSTHSTIAGGQENDIGINSDSSAIGGGGFNTIGGSSQYATIPGGNNNFATNRSFAAGTRAKANHSGAFVWGDSNNADVASTNNNSFTMRASGGYRLFSNSGATLGVYLAPNGGSWTSISDRNAKENFEPVNARAVLNKVAALPMSTWNYKSQAIAVRHIGPMAQDFKAVFGVGETDTGITTVDADGVALAAIQGLNEVVTEKDARISELEKQNAKVEDRLAALEKLVVQMTANGTGRSH
jgi:hypothetical protein